MPRSNRPNRARGGRDDDDPIDVARVFAGHLRTESKKDGLWNVQPVSPTSASKVYICPGCRIDIAPGVAHLVAWRADGLMGEADDIAARRHWHPHCWRIR